MLVSHINFAYFYYTQSSFYTLKVHFTIVSNLCIWEWSCQTVMLSWTWLALPITYHYHRWSAVMCCATVTRMSPFVCYSVYIGGWLRRTPLVQYVAALLRSSMITMSLTMIDCRCGELDMYIMTIIWIYRIYDDNIIYIYHMTWQSC